MFRVLVASRGRDPTHLSLTFRWHVDRVENMLRAFSAIDDGLNRNGDVDRCRQDRNDSDQHCDQNQSRQSAYRSIPSRRRSKRRERPSNSVILFPPHIPNPSGPGRSHHWLTTTQVTAYRVVGLRLPAPQVTVPAALTVALRSTRIAVIHPEVAQYIREMSRSTQPRSRRALVRLRIELMDGDEGRIDPFGNHPLVDRDSPYVGSGGKVIHGVE